MTSSESIAAGRDVVIFKDLLNEVNGHFFEKINADSGAYHCRHEQHRGDSELEQQCWKACVTEFIDNQTCPAGLNFQEENVDIHVTCRLARHDSSLNHKGLFVSPGGLEREYSWNSNTLEGSRDG